MLNRDIIGESKVSEQIRTFVLEASRVDSPVLILGETGVGKDIIAQCIHQLSRRKDGAYVAINCACIHENLAESELFGHRRGSFTDAKEDRIGLIKKAEKGTLFLDEIAELPFHIQAKFLRVLEQKTLRRIGENEDTVVDVRIISSTNRNLHGEVKAGKFRKDLFFRINLLEITVPPLRERKDDIICFLELIMNETNLKYKDNKKISYEALEKISNYSFPGNIRELENIIERAYLYQKGDEILHQNIVFQSSDLWQSEAREDDYILKIYNDMINNGKSYWDIVHKPFLKRDLNRHQVRDILTIGLNQTKGCYKKLLPLFKMSGGEKDYKKFMKIINFHNLK